MVRLLISLLALFALPAFAVTPGNAPIITISGPGQNTQALSIPLSSLPGTGVNGVFTLYGSTSGGANAGNWYVLYKNGTAYATGTTTKAYCTNIRGSSSGGGTSVQLVSSQAAITNNSSTALSSPSYQGGASGVYPLLLNATANTYGASGGNYTFGDGVHATYAAFQMSTGSFSAFLEMECFEQ